MNRIPEEAQIRQNLKDAGCDEAAIQKFFQLQNEGKTKELLRLLSLHRAALLDCIHTSQHRIDCLDYLIYSIKQATK